jgi:predicted SnoaL-like aldol condensation-catalyzing enzyme
MSKSGAAAIWLWTLLVCLCAIEARTAFAAGAVEMQVEHIVVQTIDEYNQAMAAGDPQPWLRYFTDDVRRHSPLSDQQGKQDFADYYAWEFKNFQAKYVTNKILVSGRSAAVVFDWEGVHKASGTPIKLQMVGIYEMASSGKFDAVSFYFDTAKVAQLFAASGAGSK